MPVKSELKYDIFIHENVFENVIGRKDGHFKVEMRYNIKGENRAKINESNKVFM